MFSRLRRFVPLLALLTLVSCNAPDPLAGEVATAEGMRWALDGKASQLASELNVVDANLKSAEAPPRNLKWRRILLTQRAETLRDKPGADKELKEAVISYNSLVAQWEHQHKGQKYKPTQGFWCF